MVVLEGGRARQRPCKYITKTATVLERWWCGEVGGDENKGSAEREWCEEGWRGARAMFGGSGTLR